MSEAKVHPHHRIDMTEGGIVRRLLAFAAPLLISQIFIRLYSTVDTWVVGNYVSDQAFAAVGSTGSITNMLVAVASGFTGGAGIVLSQYYGAKNEKKVHDVLHTALTVTLILSAAIAALGILLTPVLLRVMKTPEEVIADARIYLTLIFLGQPGSLLYGIFANALRTQGNYRRPIVTMVTSAILNTVLDLVFVLWFHWGVAGVALATLIAHYYDALIGALGLTGKKTEIRLNLRELHIDHGLTRKIVRIAVPTTLQMSITAFSNIFVQSYINAFDTYAMGGWTVRNRLDPMLSMAATVLTMALSQFVGQNVGAGKYKRARKGIRIAQGMTLGATAVLVLLAELFAPDIVRIFSQTPEVVEYGTLFVRLQAPFYLVYTQDQVYASALRGAGNTKTPMLVMVGSYVVFRQIYLFVVSHLFPGEIVPVVLAFPAGWVLACTVMTIYYHSVDLAKTRVVSDDEVGRKEQDE